MSVLACGFNHRDVNLAEREQFALPQEVWPACLMRAREFGLQEAVVLSTCNRTEVYAITDSDHSTILQWLGKYQGAYPNSLLDKMYCHQNSDAVRHLMRVASGVDSMVIGEPQIFGQLKSAYQVACDAGSVGKHFRHLFPAAFSASKQVRSQTKLGVGAVSLSYAVCQIVRQLYTSLDDCHVLCVGAGETIEAMLTHLTKQKKSNIQIVNRSHERALLLAKDFSVEAECWENLPSALARADIVITATGSQQPIITAQQVQAACEKRHRDKPFFFADLAVPRDVEPMVADLPGVFLYNLDEFQQVLEKNQQSRHQAADQAEALIDEHCQRFFENKRVAGVAGAITDFRSNSLAVRDELLARALAQVEVGRNPRDVLTRFAHDITNKLMHKPIQFVRDTVSQEGPVSADPFILADWEA